MKVLWMLFHDFLIRKAGFLLIFLGVAGHVFNYNFDYITGRNPTLWRWGWIQWLAFFGFSFLIYWGWVIKRAYADWDKDIKEVRSGKGN